jgi:hypothetical protein
MYHAPHRPKAGDDNLTVLMMVLSAMALIVIGFVIAAR